MLSLFVKVTLWELILLNPIQTAMKQSLPLQSDLIQNAINNEIVWLFKQTEFVWHLQEVEAFVCVHYINKYMCMHLHLNPLSHHKFLGFFFICFLFISKENSDPGTAACNNRHLLICHVKSLMSCAAQNLTH